MKDQIGSLVMEGTEADRTAGTFERLLKQPVDDGAQLARWERIDGVIVGKLIGFLGPYEPLIVYPGQPGTAAIIARTSVDLSAEHIGQEVTLVFEGGDAVKPIVIGRIRNATAWPMSERPSQVEVEADGQRLTVTATDRLVLTCGKASITLTAAGKVLIRGVYVSSQSSGVQRIQGGSVQIN